MLRQYQLHGGIRRPQPRFGQTKQFKAIATMATSAAPTPWNHPPPIVDDFRWWDNIFLKFPQSTMLDDSPEEHQQKFLAVAQHGEMHAFLVPALNPLLSCLDPPSVKKAHRQETLKTSSFSQPQTTHFFCIHRNHLTSPLARTIDEQNTEGYHHHITLPRTKHHVPQHPSKHPDACAMNRGTGLLSRHPPAPKQHLPADPHQQRGKRRLNRRHCTHHNPHLMVSVIDNPLNFHRNYPETFNAMTGANKKMRKSPSACKTNDIRPCSRSRSCSAPKSPPQIRMQCLRGNPIKNLPPIHINSGCSQLQEGKGDCKSDENLRNICPSRHSAPISRSTCERQGGHSFCCSQLHGSRQETSRQFLIPPEVSCPGNIGVCLEDQAIEG
jgi:hypothetical protein